MSEQVHREGAPRLTDPDPFTLALAVIGALGGVAGVLSYGRQAREDSRAHARAEDQFELQSACDSIRSAHAKLARAYHDYLDLCERYGNRTDPDASPIAPADRPPRFGRMRLLLDEDGRFRYSELVERVLRAIVEFQRSLLTLSFLLDRASWTIPSGLREELSRLAWEADEVLDRGVDPRGVLSRVSELLEQTGRVLATVERTL